MNRNHSENLKIIENDRKEQDELKLARSERILNDYIMISEGYAKDIKTTYDIQRISKNVLLKEVENLIKDCKKIREYDCYHIKNRQVKMFELADRLISISKNIEILLITQGSSVYAIEISKKFNE